MAVGVSSHQVSGLAELPDSVGIEKSAPANETGCDEEMPQPTAALQLVRYVERTAAAVIEGEEEPMAGPGEIDFRDELGGQRGSGDLLQVIRKLRGPQLVGLCPIPLKSRLLRPVGDVMEAKARDQSWWPPRISRPGHTPARV
jgi:hypothetical protein